MHFGRSSGRHPESSHGWSEVHTARPMLVCPWRGDQSMVSLTSSCFLFQKHSADQVRLSLVTLDIGGIVPYSSWSIRRYLLSSIVSNFYVSDHDSEPCSSTVTNKLTLPFDDTNQRTDCTTSDRTLGHVNKILYQVEEEYFHLTLNRHKNTCVHGKQ